MERLSHSELRHRILIALNDKPADSISALARSLDILRPSVSRAVKSLEEAGLVIKDRQAIKLTEAGEIAVKEFNLSLARKVNKTTDLATRIIMDTQKQAEQFERFVNNPAGRLAMEAATRAAQMAPGVEAVARLTQITPAIEANIRAMQIAPGIEAIAKLAQITPAMEAATRAAQSMEAIARFAQITPAMEAATKAAQSMEAITRFTRIPPVIEATLKAAAQIQSINLGWLQAPSRAWTFSTTHFIVENNALISSMMVDIEAMGKIPIAPHSALARLLNVTVRSTRAYETYFKELAPKVSLIQEPGSLKQALIIPTTGTSALMNSSRGIIEAQTISQNEEQSAQAETTQVVVFTAYYAELVASITTLLAPLGKRFTNKWEGAWQTLYSSNKDRHSQAAHSARELLMQLLAHLAPDDVFTNEECVQHKGKPSRRMRIKHILGEGGSKSTADLIDSFASTLDNVYDVLAGEAHRRDGQVKADQDIGALLIALGCFLSMLLNGRNKGLL